jgi:hypothetical protein
VINHKKYTKIIETTKLIYNNNIYISITVKVINNKIFINKK